MKKIFLSIIVMLLLSIFLISCNNKKSDNQLEYNIYYKIGEQSFGNIGYLNYDDIRIKDSEKNVEPSGIYSNNTSDMKITWNQSDVYDESIEIMKLFQNITLNGNKIKLPMDFKELGESFIGFENINLDIVENDKLPINYKDLNSKHQVTLLNKIDSLENKNTKKYMSILSDERNMLCRLEIAQIDKQTKVAGISTSIHTPFQSQYDLKINGIGIGNTLNEMYDKLGKPTIHSFDEDGNKTIFYMYNSQKQNATYFIIIQSSNKSKEHIDIKNNVITDVSISYSIN